MKNIVIIFLLSFSGCASMQNQTNISYKYQQLIKMEPGKATENDIVSLFGPPTTHEEKNGYYILNYSDAGTRLQRLSVHFAPKSNVMLGFLWVPHVGEREFDFHNIQSDFKNAHFKEISEESQNPHMIYEDLSYVDDHAGITVKMASNRTSVEAIAVYDVSKRVPTATKQKSNTPYTFGDEFSETK